MMFIASIVGTATVFYLAQKRNLSRVAVIDIGWIGTLTGIIGARIFHIVIEYPWYYLENPTHVWQIWRGGLVWYGGVLVATGSIIAYLRYRKLPLLPYLDVTAVAIAAVLFFGRLGCFSVGCCYGKSTHLPWGLVFPPTTEAGRQFPGIPLHPTQVYEMASMVMLFAISFWVERHKRFYGQTTSLYLMLYAVSRSTIEIFRGDADRGLFYGISTSQILSIVAFLIGAVFYAASRKRYPV